MIEDPSWRFRWLESQIGALTRDDVQRAGHRLAVVLGDLSVSEVEQLIREHLWPAELGTTKLTLENLLTRAAARLLVVSAAPGHGGKRAVRKPTAVLTGPPDASALNH